MVIPPPLCAFRYTLQKNVNSIVFPAFNHCDDILAVMDDNSIAVFTNGKESVNEKCNELTYLNVVFIHLKLFLKSEQNSNTFDYNEGAIKLESAWSEGWCPGTTPLHLKNVYKYKA